MDRRERKHQHARSHLRRKLQQQRDGRQVQLVERSPEREARSGTVSKTFQPVQRVAYYVGSFPVPNKGENAHEFVNEKMSKLIVNAQQLAGKPIKLFILPTGIKVYQVDGETLFMAHALPRITMTAPLTARKLFAFVAVNPPSKGAEAFCHCFHCNQAEYITELSALVTKAFKLAYAARVSNEKKFDEDRPPAAAPAGAPPASRPGCYEQRTIPAKPPRTGAGLKHSQSNIEGPRPQVQKRPSSTATLPHSIAGDIASSASASANLMEQQRQIEEERRQLLERKNALLAQNKSIPGPGAQRLPPGQPGQPGQPGIPGTIPRQGGKGPPPSLPERKIVDTLPVGAKPPGASSGVAPATAAAASKAALANRSSFHGGGMMKRRVAKSKSADTGAGPGPMLPPREVGNSSPSLDSRGPPRPPKDVGGVTARQPPATGQKPRPASVAAMPAYSLCQPKSKNTPPPPIQKKPQEPSEPPPPIRKSSQQPPPPEVEVQYDPVERGRQVEVDDDYDMVSFDVTPTAQAEEANRPKPKPRQSVRRKKPTGGVKVSFSDDVCLYDDVPADEMAPPVPDKIVYDPVPEVEEDVGPHPPARKASVKYDMRVRSNSCDYEDLSAKMKPPSTSSTTPATPDSGMSPPPLPPYEPEKESQSSPAAEPAGMQPHLSEDYEFMACQPTPPTARTHTAAAAKPAIPMAQQPESHGPRDEEAEIDEQLRELDMEEDELREAEWFQAAIPRELAMDILRQQPTGGFVVRNSRTVPNAYSLTVKSPSSKLVSFLIKRNPSTNLLSMSDATTETFADLPSMVEYYSVQTGSSTLPCPLCISTSNPAAKQGQEGMVFDDKDYEKSDFSQMMPLPGNR